MPESWRFAFITDSHLGLRGGGVNNPGSGEYAAQRLRAIGPQLVGCDFVLHGGDLVEHGLPEEIAEARAILADWPCPTWLCLGNHDAVAPGQREAWPVLAPELFPGQRFHFSFSHQGLHFAVLQSWWRDPEGVARPYWVRQAGCLWVLPDEQLAWLEADLTAHRHEPTVVVNHPLSVPLTARLTGGVDEHTPPVPDQVAALRAVLAHHPQVKVLLGGHAHAHQIHRADGVCHVATGCLPEFPYEYRVITALGAAGIPVPRTWCLCEDEGVIGRAFFVMDCVEGRVLWDQSLPGMSNRERAAIYDEMNRVIAALHGVDYTAIGLGDYGKPGNYFARQIGRWSKQYRASETERIDAMDRLIDWLPGAIPEGDETSIVHGDYRLDNLIYHASEPRILAILDWELSTLGHPLADFAY
ncbi:MAG: phosphotransferase, partial [Armatimonadetes bacterium]|nr:phosphotransferase [Armatimonadota bacterium]